MSPGRRRTLKIALWSVCALVIAVWGVKMHAEDKVRQVVRQAVNQSGQGGGRMTVNFRDQDLYFDPWRMALRLDNLDVTPAASPADKSDASPANRPALHIDRLLILDLDLDHPIPHHVSLRAEGLRLPATEAVLGLLAGELRQQGADSLTGDLDLAYGYAPESKDLTIRTLGLEVPGWGRAKASLSLGNVDLGADTWWKNFTASIQGGELGLFPAAKPSAVTAPALTPANATGPLAQAALAEIDRDLALAERDGNAKAQAALTALRHFAAEPGPLAVSLKPKEPVPVLYLFMGRNIPEIFSLLRVEVREG